MKKTRRRAMKRPKVSGEFTGAEIGSQAEKVSLLNDRLRSLKKELAEKRAVAAKGEAESEADKLEAVMDDEDFQRASQALASAVSRHMEAEKAFKRCRPSWNKPMTPLALERRQARDDAMGVLNRRQTEMAMACEKAGVESPGTHHRWPLAFFRDKVRNLRRSYEIRNLPEDIQDLERELSRERAILSAIEPLRVSEEKVRQFALSISKKARDLLVKLCGPYTPRLQTVFVSDRACLFEELEKAGLIERRDSRMNPAPVLAIGREVARYVENMPGQEKGIDVMERCAITPAEIRRGFGPSAVAEMVEKVQLLLEKLEAQKEDDVGRMLIWEQAGWPAGSSVSILRTRKACRWMLMALGQKEVSEENEPPPVPSFEPGNIPERGA